MNALENGSDISMVQSEGWIFKWPGEWKKEKYRLILRGFECTAQTMIALTPTHFITKRKEKEKEISGPLVELTTAITGKNE
jgi:hypothetical protein